MYFKNKHFDKMPSVKFSQITNVDYQRWQKLLLYRNNSKPRYILSSAPFPRKLTWRYAYIQKFDVLTDSANTCVKLTFITKVAEGASTFSFFYSLAQRWGTYVRSATAGR